MRENDDGSVNKGNYKKDDSKNVDVIMMMIMRVMMLTDEIKIVIKQ